MSDVPESNIKELIARVDERTKSIQDEFYLIRDDIRNQFNEVTVRMNTAEQHYDEKIKTLEKDFVKRTEFTPIQRLVYGFVAIVVTTVILALLSTVIINNYPKVTPTVQVK